MMVNAAAEKWGVDAAGITVSEGVISHSASSNSASFGDLAALAAQQPVPEAPVLKTPDQFVFIGKEVSRKDTGKTDGSAIYTQDINLPDMLTAMVWHTHRDSELP